MPRIRSIHPELCTDETLAEISAEAERTFIRLMPHLDDDGRAADNPKLLKAALYPLHDGVTADDVDGWLWELARHGLVIRYQHPRGRFLTVKPESWQRWQKPRWRYESKHPSPDESSVIEMPDTSDVRTTDDGRTPEGEVGVVGDGGVVEMELENPAFAHQLNEQAIEGDRIVFADEQMLDRALDILYHRRPVAHTNPERHRAVTIDAIRFQYADTIATLNGGIDWTPETLAEWIEPVYTPHRHHLEIVKPRKRCEVCDDRPNGYDVDDNGYAIPCPVCGPGRKSA